MKVLIVLYNSYLVIFIAYGLLLKLNGIVIYNGKVDTNPVSKDVDDAFIGYGLRGSKLFLAIGRRKLGYFLTTGSQRIFLELTRFFIYHQQVDPRDVVRFFKPAYGRVFAPVVSRVVGRVKAPPKPKTPSLTSKPLPAWAEAPPETVIHC